jgi:hypothetical protein
VFRLLPLLAFAATTTILSLGVPGQAAETESARVKAVREKVLPAKLKLDIDKKMLAPILSDDLPAAIKESTGVTIKIEKVPGTQGITFTSSFELKGEMTLEQAINKICDDRSWGWYVNVGKAGDQKDGNIFLTTNPKERGYKEGTGAGGKEVAKKDDPKSKEKPKDDPKGGGDEKEAAEMLSKAKLQISLKQTDKAKATLDEIVSKFPDSKQAADAKKLLEKIGK